MMTFKNPIILILAVLAATGIVYLFSMHSPFRENVYNSYSLQAQSWLNGRLDLPVNYSHLEIATYNGKYYISFPPFPSLFLLPFVFLMGTHTPDNLLALVFMVVSAVYAFRLAELLTKDREKSLFLSLFLCLGSNYLHVGIWGSVWYLAQNMSFSFCLMSLYYAATEKKRHTAASLFCFACAIGCRPLQAVYLPLLFYWLFKRYGVFSSSFRTQWKQAAGYFVKASIPAVLLGCFYLWLNAARFSNVFEFGHNYLPEFLEAEYGQFSLTYIADNLHSLFFRFPEFDNNGIAQFPRFNGVAFWIASPIVLAYALAWAVSFVRMAGQTFTTKKNGIAESISLKTEWQETGSLEAETMPAAKQGGCNLFFSVPFFLMLHLIILCAHRTLGGHHFGNRYTVDALPFLFFGLLLLCGHKKTKDLLSVIGIPLFLFGLGLNMAGSILYFSP